MKKFVLSVIILLSTFCLFGETYEVSVKGTVYKRTPEEELVQLEETDVIDDEDEIIISKGGVITFYKNGKKIVLKGGSYKVSELK